ncbi:mechanosensitive ion channel family protein [Candidatus Kaiserbacteria bacterium]|nr:mechanosensitive ion channel family protein [Candidatus Kaiserbacteria bacterium]
MLIVALKALFIILLIVSGKLALHWIVNTIVTGISLMDASNDFKRFADTWVKGALHLIGNAAIFYIAFFLALDLFGYDIFPSLLGAGIATIVIGMLISPIVGILAKEFSPRIFIWYEGQYHVDEYIRVNGYEGMVEKITFRITILRGNGGEVHMIPHSSMGPVTNLSRGYYGDPKKKGN